VILAPLAAAGALALGPQAPGPPALAFVDAAHGWLGTRSGIVGTRDGGRTWTPQTRIETDALAAVDGTHAWAIAGQGQLLRTTDGRHWRNLGVRHLLTLAFVDRRRGFALERSGILLRTGDAGASWPVVPRAPRSQALCVADAARGWLAQGGVVRSTADGGRTWRATRLRPTRQGLPVPALGCRGADVWVVFHEGAAAGTSGYEVYRSLDGGRRWREVLATPSQRRLPAISNYAGPFAVLGGGAAVLAGSCGPCGGTGTRTLVATRDGGRTFSRRTSGGPPVQALSFPDAGHGWIVAGGRVRRVR
jgi:photosystem II stability/assembly factor-like uncharacterized protein